MSHSRKHLGQFFTPPEVAQTLARWVISSPAQRLLDPSCGDGEFLACHRRSVGIEVDRAHALTARQRAPAALIHEGDFFLWSSRTTERFDAVAGNPPFIRYQLFSGETRDRAFREAAKLGAEFNGLSSSWAPFIIVAARLLKPGGKMAFVVPAEIGHATYAKPLLEALCRNFERVHVVACREKLFPALSEDCWILSASGFGASTREIHLSVVDQFMPGAEPPEVHRSISVADWRRGGCRLRKFIISEAALSLYRSLCEAPGVLPFSDVAHAGIGYVTGANDFFHLRPTEARFYGLPDEFFRVAIRKAEQLPNRRVDRAAVSSWLANDEPVLLLHLRGVAPLPRLVQEYLDSTAGQSARKAYKCRVRNPWYVVPDVKVPDAFLSYMSGLAPTLVANTAGCVCTNSVHAVQLRPGFALTKIQRAWEHPFCRLSSELEGHPLGGGMLKLEPGEAANVRLPMNDLHLTRHDEAVLQSALTQTRRWRHYA